MWTCPKCKQRFVNRGQWHSCGQNTLDEFIAGKTPASVRLFQQFIDTYRKIGVFEIHPAKTRIALVGEMRFCAINRLGKDFLNGHLVLSEKHAHSSCFYKIEQFGDHTFVHHFKLRGRNEINHELFEYMKKAYVVGQRDMYKA